MNFISGNWYRHYKYGSLMKVNRIEGDVVYFDKRWRKSDRTKGDRGFDAEGKGCMSDYYTKEFTELVTDMEEVYTVFPEERKNSNYEIY